MLRNLFFQKFKPSNYSSRIISNVRSRLKMSPYCLYCSLLENME